MVPYRDSAGLGSLDRLPYVAGLGSLLRMEEMFSVDRLSSPGLGSLIFVFVFKLVVEPVYLFGFDSVGGVLAAPYFEELIFFAAEESEELSLLAVPIVLYLLV